MAAAFAGGKGTPGGIIGTLNRLQGEYEDFFAGSDAAYMGDLNEHPRLVARRLREMAGGV